MKVNKLVLVSFLFLVTFFGKAQETGIQFERISSFKELLTQASIEGKYLFIDCYTTWCGPCKFMDKEVFIQDTVGKFYNKHFISARFQMDSTNSDAIEIKNHYADASFIQKTYSITFYPTYLFFNAKGELVHRELGSCPPKVFIQKGKNALDPETQYFTQVKKYNEGSRDPQLLKKLALLALGAMDDSARAQYAKSYISSIGPLRNPDDYKFIFQTTTSTSDTGFHLMIIYGDTFGSIIGKNQFHDHIINLIVQNELLSHKVNYNGFDKKRWNTFSKRLTSLYPDYSEEVLFFIQTNVFFKQKRLSEYANRIDDFIAKHSISDQQLNNFAWMVFSYINDRKLLIKALRWSKKSFTNQGSVDPGFIDTYANLLYKIGKPKEAIEWEKKAREIAMQRGANGDWGQDVMDKIIKGQKTW